MKEVKVFDKLQSSRDIFVEQVSKDLKSLELTPTDSAREAVYDSDVLVTVTPSREPIIENDWIEEGTHINAIGADAPGKQELDPMILKRAKIVVDDRQQAYHHGDLSAALSKKIISGSDLYGELADIIAGKLVGRESDAEISVFAATGLAVEDAVSATRIYKKALDSNRGTSFNLIS